MNFTALLFSVLLSLPGDTGTGKKFVPAQKRFVKELYESGDYFNCIAEARRLQYYSGSAENEYLIYTCYYLAGQYYSVINGIHSEKNGGTDGLPFRLLVSQSYLEIGKYAESYGAMGLPLYTGLEKPDAFYLLLRRLEPVLLTGDYDTIDREIMAAQGELSGYDDFFLLSRDLEAFRENEGISPLTGGIMSAIIPGLGQLWTGRFLDAFLSLVSVALPAAGGVCLMENGEKGTAYTMFFFTGIFYAGNIYGGYNSASLDIQTERRVNHKEITERYGGYDPRIYIEFGRDFN